MKRIIKKATLSGAAMAFLVAALLQVAEPTGVRAQEGPDDECMGAYLLCGVEIKKTCVLWVFFCTEVYEYLYYHDVYHTQ